LTIGEGKQLTIGQFCPSGYAPQQVMSPVRMEHKFDSLREHCDKREGIERLFTVISMSPSCSLLSLIALKSLPRAIIVDLIPVYGLGGKEVWLETREVQYTIGVKSSYRCLVWSK